MAQVKKEEVREAILAAAFTLFRDHGYTATSMAQIARTAGVSTSNIYVYFPAKLGVLLAVYEPWLRQHLDQLCANAGAHADRGQRLRVILRGLWHDIPGADNGFAATWIQAIATAGPDEQASYRRDMLLRAEAQLSAVISGCLPRERAMAIARDDVLSHILFMAFDGFAVNHRLRGPSRRIDQTIEAMATLLEGAALR